VALGLTLALLALGSVSSGSRSAAAQDLRQAYLFWDVVICKGSCAASVCCKLVPKPKPT
jgi:hypothetical protein